MNSAHDLGGVPGFGPINPEPEASEPVFHAEWEKRALGLTLAAGFLGQWNIDMSRHARERQHPADYLSNSYYQTWLVGLETLLQETHLADASELVDGTMHTPASEALRARCVPAEQVAGILAKGGPADMPTPSQQQFQVGDRVRVKLYYTRGHTRAPQYVRGHTGVISEYIGSHVYPDDSAQGKRAGGHLYNVRFTARELWGADNNDHVHLDLWQQYLEAV